MSIGKHNKIIVISGRASGGGDGYGGRSEVWVSKYTGWASIEKVRGSRSVEAGAAALGSVFEIMVRKAPGLEILKTDKIEDLKTEGVVDANNDTLNDADGAQIINGGVKDRTFTIISVDEDKRWYTITAGQTS